MATPKTPRRESKGLKLAYLVRKLTDTTSLWHCDPPFTNYSGRPYAEFVVVSSSSAFGRGSTMVFASNASGEWEKRKKDLAEYTANIPAERAMREFGYRIIPRSGDAPPTNPIIRYGRAVK